MLVGYHLSWLRLCAVSCVLIQTRHFLCVFVRHTDNTITRIRSSGKLIYLKRVLCRGQFKCDGTCAETRFRLSAKRMSPLKSVGASVQSTTGSRGVRISGSNAGYTMFRGSGKGTGHPLHSAVSPSLPVPCILCHHISTGVYHKYADINSVDKFCLHT
jgi:hypothetical protein